jgi:hypothetical protein
LAFCILTYVGGMPHRLRDWGHKATLKGRLGKPPHVRGRFDWVENQATNYTHFASREEAEVAAGILKVEEPHVTFKIVPLPAHLEGPGRPV